MNDIQRILPAALLAMMPLAASAQDINSTVEVRKAYEGKLHEVSKPQMKMQVPDSVTHFDLAFDYDRFQSRYTSSYEFHPHLLDLKPNAQIDNGNELYMKLGAGYTLHPYLDLVWSPSLKNAWKINVYASHHSYAGNYFNIGAPLVSPDLFALSEGHQEQIPSSVDLDKYREDGKVSHRFGYDLQTTAGFDSRYDWKNTVLMIDAGYYGLAQKDWMKARSYNALDAGLRFFSKSVKPDRFHYDLRLDYRFGADHTDYREGPDRLVEHDYSVNLLIGPVVKEKHKVMFDFGFDGASYCGAFRSFAGNVYAAPQYIYEQGRWDIAAGIRFSKLLRNSKAVPEMHKSKEQIVYPDIRISFTAIKNGMDIYLKAVGGNDINTYSSILEKNHFADFRYGREVVPLLNNDVTRISSAFGLRGRITPYFSYDLSGGYENHANALMDALMVTPAGCLPALGYVKYQNAFASADLRFDSGAVAAAVTARYNYTDFLEDAYGIFKPSAVQAYASVTYNWHKRIYAGIGCEFASGRKAVLDRTYRIRAYADLGLYLEYKHTSRLSFWAKGGNLLFQTIQRNPLYAEKGGNFTVGICLNL